jgi:hypothetical protein
MSITSRVPVVVDSWYHVAVIPQKMSGVAISWPHAILNFESLMRGENSRTGNRWKSRRTNMHRILSVLMCAAFLTASLLAQDRRHDRDEWTYDPNGNYTWDQSWNRRGFPGSGACFFKDYNFQGDRFCIRRGERLPHLPGNFGDHISSIRLFGGASVAMFNDRDFRGGSAELHRSVNDLHKRRFRDGHTWNDRISSVIVQ